MLTWHLQFTHLCTQTAGGCKYAAHPLSKMTQYSRIWVLTQFLTHHLVLKDQEAAPGTSLAVQWLGLSTQNIGGISSIPVQGSKILRAALHMFCQKHKWKLLHFLRTSYQSFERWMGRHPSEKNYDKAGATANPLNTATDSDLLFSSTPAIQPVTPSVLKGWWGEKNSLTGEQIKQLPSLMGLFLLYNLTFLLPSLSMACTEDLKKTSKKQSECGFGSRSPSPENWAYTHSLLPSHAPEHCLQPYNIFWWVNEEQLSLVCQSILFSPWIKEFNSLPLWQLRQGFLPAFLPGFS